MQPINLLPDLKTRRRERLQVSLPRLLLRAALIWVLLLAGVLGGFYWHRYALATQLQTVNQEIAALEPVAERVAQLRELAQQVQQLRQLIADNTQGAIVPALDLLASLMPPEILAQQVSYDSGKISLACYSTALAPIGQLYTNLQQTGQFVTIQFSAISSVQQDLAGVSQGYAFTVSFDCKGEQSHE